MLPKLDLLRLDENKVGAAGWELFANAIRPGTSEAFMSVRHLQIQRNQLGDRSMKFFLPQFRAVRYPSS